MKRSKAPRGMGSLHVILLALALLLVVAPAFAEDSQVLAELQWDRPADSPCIDQGAIVAQVEKILGRSVFVSAAHADVAIHGRFERDGSGWAVEIEMSRADGSHLGARRLSTRAANCLELERSLPVVLALMVDVPRAEVIVVSTKPKPRPKSARKVVNPVAQAPWRVALGLGPSVGVGLVPWVGWGGSAFAALEAPSVLGLELRVRELHGGVERFGGEARFVSREAALLGCARTGKDPLSALALCSGVGGGWLRAEPDGFDEESPQTRLTASASLSARGTLALSRSWGVRLGAFGALSLVRDEFQYDDEFGAIHSFHRPSLVQGAVDLSIMYVWPL